MIGIIITAIVSVIAGILLGNGVEEMKEKHPDYKGEDFLDWDNNHTEGEI